MTDVSEKTKGSEGQTFLVGSTIYLRGVELGDAKTTPLWRSSPFPISAEVAEEWLKKEIPEMGQGRAQRLIACRIDDDRPVGSVRFESWDARTGWLSDLTADPALGEAGGAIRAEIVRLVVPWLIERDLMVIWVGTVHGDAPVEAAVAELELRQAYRLREEFWQNGERRDEIVYECLHPVWAERLGPLEPAVEGSVEREVRRPASLQSPALTGDPPANAMVIGERVYLRPLEADDMDKIARWSRQETETFYDNGRAVRSPIRIWHWHKKLAEEDPPEWIRFAIVLRENDELIGANGIAEISWIHKTAETESEIFLPEHRGGGLGTEAKHLLLTYAFDRLGLHNVRSFVWAPNTRSAAALRKQGYRDAGRLHLTGIKGGDFTDDVVFDLLASEWRTARRES